MHKYEDLGDGLNLTDDALMDFAFGLGYVISAEDCDEIRRTSFEGETVRHAIKDFLSAYENPGVWK